MIYIRDKILDLHGWQEYGLERKSLRCNGFLQLGYINEYIEWERDDVKELLVL